ncbi:lamin tail domain-containing protein, partial [bacterium]|nr:lamin tail domain-containing protein [bacterium]
MISEFMAANSKTLSDEDGDSSDWLELYNDGPGAVNLSGWFLTDSPGELARWTLPATNIPGGGYLLVFASGKDRSVPGKELHANFKLGAAGEYLALVLTDGVTVVSSYGPGYPPQRQDISYGLPMETVMATNAIIPTGVFCRAIVPTSGTLGLTWTARTFNDASWRTGTTSAGYDAKSAEPNLKAFIGVDFRTSMYNIAPTCYMRVPFTAPDLSEAQSVVLKMWYDDGFVAYLNGT